MRISEWSSDVCSSDLMLDAEQVREEAVAARLREHALARVNQDHGKVDGRSAGDHVARILLVPRGVGDDELALLCGEKAVGDVDREIGRASCRERVCQYV